MWNNDQRRRFHPPQRDRPHRRPGEGTSQVRCRGTRTRIGAHDRPQTADRLHARYVQRSPHGHEPGTGWARCAGCRDQQSRLHGEDISSLLRGPGARLPRSCLRRSNAKRTANRPIRPNRPKSGPTTTVQCEPRRASLRILSRRRGTRRDSEDNSICDPSIPPGSLTCVRRSGTIACSKLKSTFHRVP